ncbi:hypothetical protein DXN04_32015 [Chitinophaga silvisoli]|uniref:Uncharacterized protein n=1 Tax=Chitinophaga silvisoli TaxID=2291814 RepID=A0A3E1NS53_9BACT|nr:hypothetical protein DXN04_32015 [Chitinophaga silvisoli]
MAGQRGYLHINPNPSATGIISYVDYILPDSLTRRLRAKNYNNRLLIAAQAKISLFLQSIGIYLLNDFFLQKKADTKITQSPK